MSLHTVKSTRLQTRIEEDSARDPLDALQDAEVLASTLHNIAGLTLAPSTRYVLSNRIREDLRCENLLTALDDAATLLDVNRKRLSAVTAMHEADYAG